MKLRGLSKVIHSKAAIWLLPLLCGVVPMTLLVVASVMRDSRRFATGGSAFIPFIAYGVILALIGYLGVWSWRTLWRAGRTEQERAVYDYGVREWSVGALLILVVVAAGSVFAIVPRYAYSWSLCVLLLAIMSIALVLGLPLCLWAGYVMGSIRASRVTGERNHTKLHDPPPIV